MSGPSLHHAGTARARRYWQGLDSLAAPLLALLWPDEALTFATLQVRRVAVAERWRDGESKQ
jgi:hypothetical protein